jgi:hypothetical protein
MSVLNPMTMAFSPQKAIPACDMIDVTGSLPSRQEKT